MHAILPASSIPSWDPSRNLCGFTSGDSSSDPSVNPSSIPNGNPSGDPSRNPSSIPSGDPSRVPSNDPSGDLFSDPNGNPSSSVVPMEITFMDNGGNIFVLYESIDYMYSYIIWSHTYNFTLDEFIQNLYTFLISSLGSPTFFLRIAQRER